MTPVELAKRAGVRPQAIYNLIRQGYIAAEKKEVVKTVLVIDDDVAAQYLVRRKERQDRAEKRAQDETKNS